LTFSIEKLSETLRAASDEQGANASVAVLLKLDGERLHVLFVRRVQNSRDPWSGQMALPGGKREAKDRDLKETVIREALEETNINLLHHCRFLGAMSAFQSKPRLGIKVLPYVVLIEDEPSIRLNKKELEEYFWISIEELVRSRTTVKSSFGKFPAFIVGSIIIWGLTYRIVESLIPRLESGASLGNDN
jgi:8-oxo-dGTP pyrophosphatase MutT (NUDIX family)